MDIYLQANGAANEGSSGGVFDHREALLVVVSIAAAVIII